MHVHEDSSWAVFTEKVKIHALTRESWSENFPRYVSMLIPGRNVLLEMTQAITYTIVIERYMRVTLNNSKHKPFLWTTARTADEQQQAHSYSWSSFSFLANLPSFKRHLPRPIRNERVQTQSNSHWLVYSIKMYARLAYCHSKNKLQHNK